MNFFGGTFFSGGFFGSADVALKTGTGGIDPPRRRRTIYKPTGLLARKPEGRAGVEQRIEETRAIEQEALAAVMAPLSAAPAPKPIEHMTAAEVDYEIGVLMRERVRLEEEEMVMLMAMLQ